MGLGAGVKSIQQGTNTESVAASAVDTVDVTITAIDMAKTEVKAWTAVPKLNAGYGTAGIAPVLTSTTNLRLFIDHGGSGASATVTYTWQVIEYF